MADLPPGSIPLNNNKGGNRPVEGQLIPIPHTPTSSNSGWSPRNPCRGPSMQDGFTLAGAHDGMAEGAVALKHSQMSHQEQLKQQLQLGMTPASMQHSQMRQPINQSQSFQDAPSNFKQQHGNQKSPKKSRNKQYGKVIDPSHEFGVMGTAYAELTTYIIMRLEPAFNPSATDSLGNSVMPTWECTTRTEVIISQEEAAQKVYELDKDTVGAMHKHNALPEVIQRQIRSAQKRLEYNEEDDRYKYELAQLESKYIEIDESNPLHNISVDEKDAQENRQQRSVKYTRDKKKREKEYKRASVTAYFRRVPKMMDDALDMLIEKRRSTRQSIALGWQQQYYVPPVLLPPQKKEYLISAFAGDLDYDIGFHGHLDSMRDRIVSCLPSLLNDFAMRLENDVSSPAEWYAKEFIRQQRDRITHLLRVTRQPLETREDLYPRRPLEGGMSLLDKLVLWDPAMNIGPPAPTNEQLDEVQVHQRYQEIRPFLLRGPAYRWLLENARSSALLTERKGTNLELVAQAIRSKLSSMVAPKSPQCKGFQATFTMDWDLLGFLRGQEYDTTLEIAIERAITVTGSSTNAQALQCVDYMCQTWPSSGREVLSGIQKALLSPNLSSSSCLFDGTEIDVNLGLLKPLIVARGGKAALTELCEQLAWLGAALRQSAVPSGLCLSTPRVTALDDIGSSSQLPSITVYLNFTVTPILGRISLTDAAGTCWHAMFRDTVVVSGFPILARHESEQGLELQLDIMSALTETRFAAHYDRTLVLKGLCTMLVPTRRTERSITWHFIFNKDGVRIPYYAFRERCPGWVGADKVCTDLLDAAGIRNFVGWTSNITRHLGTEEMEYGKIRWSEARKCSAGLEVEQKLTVSLSKIIGGSGSVVRGNRDKPEYVKQSAYPVQIENARNIYVVLYDVAARRGWLTDGASALLHLVRTQVACEPYGGTDCLFNNLSLNQSTFAHPAIDGGPSAASDSLKDHRNMKHVILREFKSYDDERVKTHQLEAFLTAREGSSHKAGSNLRGEAPNLGEGRNEVYKTTCMKELVSQTWSTLEQIYDRQTEFATNHITKQLQLPFRETLEGYDFMGIVSARRILTRRAVNLQSNGAAWITLTRRINAITLFGQHFGDIYKPAENGQTHICKDWMTIPPGHEYLAAPISLLKGIQQHSREEGEVDAKSLEIAQGLLWFPSKNAFRTCGPRCQHTFPSRVQQLRSSVPVQILQKIGWGRKGTRNADIFAKIQGAVVFGDSSVLDPEKLQLSSQSGVQNEDSFYDSGVGSSLQTSSQATPENASSGNENSNADCAGPSGDSTSSSRLS